VHKESSNSVLHGRNELSTYEWRLMKLVIRVIGRTKWQLVP